MKILLRHKETGLFWERPDHWTQNAEHAFDFRFIDWALHYADGHPAEDAEVVLQWDTPLHVEAIPLASQVATDCCQAV